ncbi:MAG: hypothetical protein QOD12_2013 [Verrucomicrobiota bacterium]|jgi:hypothetical protein
MSHIRKFALFCFFIALCLPFPVDAHGKEPAASKASLLIGRWHCAISYGEWTIERKSNGTFFKSGKLVRTLGKPAVPFSVVGSWRLEGRNYIEVWEKVTPPDWAGLNKVEKSARIVAITPGRFSRIQDDSPVFIETLVNTMKSRKS